MASSGPSGPSLISPNRAKISKIPKIPPPTGGVPPEGADATCAIIPDKPPTDVSAANSGAAKNNSPNHKGDGQNVFYNDGHVKWGVTPQPDAGDDPDIYTGGPGYERSLTDAKIIR